MTYQPDNTQELDEILRVAFEAGYYSNNGHKDGMYGETRFKECKQAIIDWNNKQVEVVLDRLESKGLNEDGGSRYVNTPDGYVAATAWSEAQDRVERAIEAERNKLKESK